MAMSPEAKLERAKYMREWRRKNPDKEREYNAKKWERKAEQNRLAKEQQSKA